MVGWSAGIEADRSVLMRIAALLLALADLAERAAGVSFLRRRQVLGCVSCSEAVARTFVIAMATGEPALVDEPISMDEPSGDAAHLAIRLRTLALALCILMLAWRFTRPGAQNPRVGETPRICGPAVRWPGVPALPAPDTS